MARLSAGFSFPTMNAIYHKSMVPVLADFHFKKFQLEDYSRGALHDGLILGHDTGGGKTIALYVWPALKVGFQTEFAPNEPRGLRPLAPVLLVAPGDLHKQTIDEGVEKFKAVVTPIDGQETFIRLSSPHPRTGHRQLPPGYYITSYTQLTGNGVLPFPAFQPDNIVGMMQILGLTDADSGEHFDQREEMYERHYKRLSALPTMTLQELEGCCTLAQRTYAGNEAMIRELRHSLDQVAPFHYSVSNPSFTDLPPEKKAVVRRLMTEAMYATYAASIGEGKWYGKKKIADPTALLQAALAGAEPEPEASPTSSPTAEFKVKCVYSPSLADLCQDTFDACAVDEGVKMKGEDTAVGCGVRQINSKYKLVLTATPIKNRLPDVFRLAWWATGGKAEAHARFPYPDMSDARSEFANEFLVSERNLTREREKPARFKKLTPQVCNVHRLWKMFAPIILRRRKADFGEDIVTKTRHVVRAPMGKEQAAVYKFHLDAKYLDKNGAPALGAQLQALRVAAANPASGMLIRPDHDLKTKGEPRSKNPYIPKLHSALKLVHQCLAKGEQAVVFSAFNDSLDVLSARLTEAGVPHCVVDGRTSQKRRGLLASQFKLGPGRSPHQVMLAGVECMAEGHSFPLCNNVILLCYSWAYDKFEQAINRVHRLNSRWPVNVYPIICDRSIDRKLEAMIQEKGDAAELVLDGHLMGEQAAEVNLAELLDIARKEFADGAKTLITVDEAALEQEWPALRADLNGAVRGWRLKGLELRGIESAATVIELPEQPAAADAPIRFHLPASTERGQSDSNLNLEGEVIDLFAGLPLFELA